LGSTASEKGEPKMRVRRTFVAIAGAMAVCAVTPAAAHEADRMTAHRAGPIRNGETTVAEAKDRFGEPTRVKKTKIGCEVKITKLFWGKRLKVYFAGWGSNRKATETWVRRRNVATATGGEMTFHTRRMLRVGDSLKRLKAKYPKAEPTHGPKGWKHWDLRLPKTGVARLEAIVHDGRVTALLNAPYEYC
jgi:hypothetical protein